MRRHIWIRKLVKDFEQNPKFQAKFHLTMMGFWVINLVAGTLVLVLLPHLWLTVGVFYVFVLSIYANFDTDYDAVSASQASMRGEEIIAIMAGQVIVTPPADVDVLVVVPKVAKEPS